MEWARSRRRKARQKAFVTMVTGCQRGCYTDLEEGYNIVEHRCDGTMVSRHLLEGDIRGPWWGVVLPHTLHRLVWKDNIYSAHIGFTLWKVQVVQLYLRHLVGHDDDVHLPPLFVHHVRENHPLLTNHFTLICIWYNTWGCKNLKFLKRFFGFFPHL